VPITWNDVEEIIGKYEVGYSKSSIIKALECISNLWGREYFDSVSKHSRWFIVQLIDTGLMINELKDLNGFKTLFNRVRRNERAAFSEACLATFFSKLGFDVALEPESKGGQFNDLSVQCGNVTVNIEVKTPEESELKQELDREIWKALNDFKEIPTPRKIDVMFANEPVPEDLDALYKHLLEKTSEKTQPTYGLINEIAWVKTDYPDKINKDGLRWTGKVPLPLVPTIFKDIYDSKLSLFYVIIGFKGEEQTSISINVPFEDSRLFGMIRKKSKQLNEKTANIVAIDTTGISLSYSGNKERLLNLPVDELEREWSRRIGAILLYRVLDKIGKISIDSVLITHPNPYVPIPTSLLEKCDLSKYSELFDVQI